MHGAVVRCGGGGSTVDCVKINKPNYTISQNPDFGKAKVRYVRTVKIKLHSEMILRQTVEIMIFGQ